MASSVLQKNLEKIIKERNFHISELERKAGLKKNNIYYILKGISKKPSAEILQAVADALGITVKDLYTPTIEATYYLNDDHFALMEQILKNVIEEVKLLNIELTDVDFINVFLEVFRYSKQDPKKEPDKRFINWILQQRRLSK